MKERPVDIERDRLRKNEMYSPSCHLKIVWYLSSKEHKSSLLAQCPGFSFTYNESRWGLELLCPNKDKKYHKSSPYDTILQVL